LQIKNDGESGGAITQTMNRKNRRRRVEIKSLLQLVFVKERFSLFQKSKEVLMFFKVSNTVPELWSCITECLHPSSLLLNKNTIGIGQISFSPDVLLFFNALEVEIRCSRYCSYSTERKEVAGSKTPGSGRG
jgi:hypothetical protein